MTRLAQLTSMQDQLTKKIDTGFNAAQVHTLLRSSSFSTCACDNMLVTHDRTVAGLV